MKLNLWKNDQVTAEVRIDIKILEMYDDCVTLEAQSFLDGKKADLTPSTITLSKDSTLSILQKIK